VELCFRTAIVVPPVPWGTNTICKRLAHTTTTSDNPNPAGRFGREIAPRGSTTDPPPSDSRHMAAPIQQQRQFRYPLWVPPEGNTVGYESVLSPLHPNSNFKGHFHQHANIPWHMQMQMPAYLGECMTAWVHTMSNTILCHLPGDISARHIRPVELPLPLSTTDPPTSPATYAHFNGMDSFVGKDTHNAQFKGNDGDTDHDQFNGNDGFDGEGNFDGNDNDGNDVDAAQYNGSDASEGSGVCVGTDSNNDNLNFNDTFNANANFNDKDSNDSQCNDQDNLLDNDIHRNNARFHDKDNFGGSVSFEGNDNKNAHSNDNDNLNVNDNFNFNSNDNFDDKDRNNSQFNDNDNLYTYDTNGDRFAPPPRGRKRRQTTLWSSQTGETNTSASGSLVWLPEENSALKAPEHE
jgi:hypothetical protein